MNEIQLESDDGLAIIHASSLQTFVSFASSPAICSIALHLLLQEETSKASGAQ